jgi:sugar phosphate isomerase/epimerase
MQQIIEKVQVSIPFDMLCETHLDKFLEHRMNPEIVFTARMLDHYSLSDFRNVAEKFRDAGLSITFHAPFMDMSAGSTDPAIREAVRHRFEQVLRLVPLFKAKTAVCHANYEKKRYGFIRDEWIENSLAIWSWFGKCLQDQGARLMLENVYEYGPEDILILFERLGDLAGCCLDVGHQTVFSHSSLEKWLASMGPYIGQIHLHDNFGKNDDHLAPGKGTINFQPLFDYLRGRKGDIPVITLEPHGEENLRPSFEYLERVWDW